MLVKRELSSSVFPSMQLSAITLPQIHIGIKSYYKVFFATTPLDLIIIRNRWTDLNCLQQLTPSHAYAPALLAQPASRLQKGIQIIVRSYNWHTWAPQPCMQTQQG
ncbi:hypothetical protein KC19_3G034000, partial [Ceratodon purpureus]